jgi:hypothetical protein
MKQFLQPSSQPLYRKGMILQLDLDPDMPGLSTVVSATILKIFEPITTSAVTGWPTIRIDID